MNQNPWRLLPNRAPFVLPADSPSVAAYNASASPDHFLQIGKLLPEPFVGSPTAPIVLLSNNPGYGKGVLERRKPEFASKMRANLLPEPSDYPFLYLSPEFQGSGSQWWRSKLNELIEEFGATIVSRSIPQTPAISRNNSDAFDLIVSVIKATKKANKKH